MPFKVKLGILARMNILLLGSSGLLGSAFVQALENSTHTFTAPKRPELDLLDFEALEAWTRGRSFDLILHCAAYTDVDGAETQREICWKMNVELLDHLLRFRIPMIHFSSDYVFDAPDNIEIPTDHPRSPINFYGETKATAESLLENSTTPWWNIRTTWLMGGEGDFFHKIQKKIDLGQKLEIVNDQIGRPTYVSDLVAYILQHFIDAQQPSGHYHYQSAGKPVSWYELAKAKFPDAKITPVPSSSYPTAARRPKNSVLEISEQ